MPAVLIRVWLALITAVAVLVAAPAPTPPEDGARQPQTRPQVIVIGTSGLRWDDVSAATPSLKRFLDDGASAVTAIRNVRAVACPVDGWLALSAGRRAGDESRPKASLCRRVPNPALRGSATVAANWATYTRLAEDGTFGAQPGLLGANLAASAIPAAAIGPGAVIALADPDGLLHGSYRPRPRDPRDLSAAVAAAAASSRLVVVDAGAVRDPTDLLPTDPQAGLEPRAAQVSAVDEVVSAVVSGAPEGSTVIVTSLADSGLSPHLQLLAAIGPGPHQTRYATALLGAQSTRQDGMVQVTDLMPTILTLLGADVPTGLPGAVISPQPGWHPAADRYQRLIDLDQSSTGVKPLVEPFFNGLVIAQILLYGGGAFALRRNWVGDRGRRRVLAVLRRVAVVFASVPISTFLANLTPWWRAQYDLLAVVGAVCVGVALIATVALLGPWRDRRLGPLGFIGAVTAGVLALDVATGSRLQIASLMGQQPLVAGRFYGLGNVQFALFASGSLMLTISLADAALKRGRRRLAIWVVVAIGLVTVIIDGTPGIGSDFGGPPAIIPAFTLLALFVAGIRVTVQRVTLIGVVTVAVVSALSVADWLRPDSDRTHFGRFVQTVLDGGGLQVVGRKAAQNWEILTGSFLTVLLPFAAVFVGLVLMRPGSWGAPALQRTYESAPTLRHGLIALVVLVVIGFAVNDSGTVVPAISAVLVIPLLIAAGSRTLEIDDAARHGRQP